MCVLVGWRVRLREPHPCGWCRWRGRGYALQETAHTRLGGWYVVGGGVEWAISLGWTAGRHYEFDSRNATSHSGSTGGVAGVTRNPGIGTPMESAKFGAITDTLSARESWRWGRPEAAPLK